MLLGIILFMTRVNAESWNILFNHAYNRLYEKQFILFNFNFYKREIVNVMINWKSKSITLSYQLKLIYWMEIITLPQ